MIIRDLIHILQFTQRDERDGFTCCESGRKVFASERSSCQIIGYLNLVFFFKERIQLRIIYVRKSGLIL